MITEALIFAVLAFLLVAISLTAWFRRVKQSAIPANRLPFLVPWSLGALLGFASFFAAGASWHSAIPAVVAILGGGMFLFLYSMSKQNAPDAIGVGDQLPVFEGIDSTEAVFSSASLAGSPVIIIFFRGHWCPYCVAALRRVSAELGEELEQRGVQVLAVCTDSPAKIAASRSGHGLKGIFLADPKLEVTDKFGLRNLNKAVGPPGLEGLPVPTALLVNATGEVVWKDQSADYMERSDPAKIRAALGLLRPLA